MQGPLLMDPVLYFRQPVKLLIIGQETSGWCCEYRDIPKQLAAYREYDVGRGAKDSYTRFWDVTRKLEACLGIAPCSCAWSNLNRFDYNGGRAPWDVQQELSKLDFMLKEEIRILQPDVCIFYTSRNYDHRITALFPGVLIEDVEGLPESIFARLTHPALPAATLRTPHPISMQLKGTESAFIDYMKRYQAKQAT